MFNLISSHQNKMDGVVSEVPLISRLRIVGEVEDLLSNATGKRASATQLSAYLTRTTSWGMAIGPKQISRYKAAWTILHRDREKLLAWTQLGIPVGLIPLDTLLHLPQGAPIHQIEACRNAIVDKWEAAVKSGKMIRSEEIHEAWLQDASDTEWNGKLEDIDESINEERAKFLRSEQKRKKSFESEDEFIPNDDWVDQQHDDPPRKEPEIAEPVNTIVSKAGPLLKFNFKYFDFEAFRSGDTVTQYNEVFSPS
jgi:hypothetical protein